jgi:hypothetical protein
MLLIFGGLAQNEVMYQGMSISEDCGRFAPLLNAKLYPKDKLNSIFLINNCGVQLMNELWMYNIKDDEWYYTKPHIEAVDKQKVQAIPQARAYHTATYVEKIDYNLQEAKRIMRKYMYIYGGFSIYCQNACNDFWMFEIAYASQRFYPFRNQFADWNRGNRWTQIYSASSSTPGKRLKHSTVVNDDFTEILLFGGIEIVTEENKIKYKLRNDLWGYNINNNKWASKIAVGIKKQLRTVSKNNTLF